MGWKSWDTPIVVSKSPFVCCFWCCVLIWFWQGQSFVQIKSTQKLKQIKHNLNTHRHTHFCGWGDLLGLRWLRTHFEKPRKGRPLWPFPALKFLELNTKEGEWEGSSVLHDNKQSLHDIKQRLSWQRREIGLSAHHSTMYNTVDKTLCTPQGEKGMSQ